MSTDHWTAEEYREYQRTGREPVRQQNPLNISRDVLDLIEAHKNPIPQEEIERRYAEAEKRGEVMALDITEGPDGKVSMRYAGRVQETGEEPEETDSTFDKLRRRVAVYSASKLLEDRGIHGAKIVIPGHKKKPKYGNQKHTEDGITFDSTHELNVYHWLKARKQRGELRWVFVHVPFRFTSGVTYWADFMTIRADGTVETVWDAKSKPTADNRVYINKKKQLLAEWGIEITEVTAKDSDGRGGYYNPNWHFVP